MASPHKQPHRHDHQADPLPEQDPYRGVFMISVAAQMAGMHPQTLRIYEARGLIRPARSSRNTRLYSIADVQRLRRIQELTQSLGLSLAAVERFFAMEEEINRLRKRVAELEHQLNQYRRRSR